MRTIILKWPDWKIKSATLFEIGSESSPREGSMEILLLHNNNPMKISSAGNSRRQFWIIYVIRLYQGIAVASGFTMRKSSLGSDGVWWVIQHRSSPGHRGRCMRSFPVFPFHVTWSFSRTYYRMYSVHIYQMYIAYYIVVGI